MRRGGGCGGVLASANKSVGNRRPLQPRHEWRVDRQCCLQLWVWQYAPWKTSHREGTGKKYERTQRVGIAAAVEDERWKGSHELRDAAFHIEVTAELGDTQHHAKCAHGHDDRKQRHHLGGRGRTESVVAAVIPSTRVNGTAKREWCVRVRGGRVYSSNTTPPSHHHHRSNKLHHAQKYRSCMAGSTVQM